jgi:hypothetical protein
MENQFKQSIMSFKDYISSLVITNDSKLTEEWGWFIDIECYTNKLPLQLTKYHKYGKKMNQYIDYPATIKEIPSTRSFSNLNELSMTDELTMTDEEYERIILNEELSLCINVIGLLGVVAIYYTFYII